MQRLARPVKLIHLHTKPPLLVTNLMTASWRSRVEPQAASGFSVSV
jgi:hypothetical protein